MVTKEQIMKCLSNVSGLPRHGKRVPYRSIYPAARGGFYIDYAAFAGGVDEEIPRKLIDELVSEGKIVPAWPHKLEIEAWCLPK